PNRRQRFERSSPTVVRHEVFADRGPPDVDDLRAKPDGQVVVPIEVWQRLAPPREYVAQHAEDGRTFFRPWEPAAICPGKGPHPARRPKKARHAPTSLVQ